MGRFYNACLLMALAFSPLLVEGQDSDPTGWEGCVDPENRDALVTIGEKTTICLVIADGVDWSFERQYMRLHFQPIADEYSRFHVPNCKFVCLLFQRSRRKMFHKEIRDACTVPFQFLCEMSHRD